ncbi:MAG: hypothetical protein HOA17_09770 [Candidatus Melainabacteria bacterium]|jgi:hypothetical protein|nr:hypothetical protein [Candidatus Melainabacteria bacterium]
MIATDLTRVVETLNKLGRVTSNIGANLRQLPHPFAQQKRELATALAEHREALTPITGAASKLEELKRAMANELGSARINQDRTAGKGSNMEELELNANQNPVWTAMAESFKRLIHLIDKDLS